MMNKCEFYRIGTLPNGKPKRISANGYSFELWEVIYYIYYYQKGRHWIVINPYTGYEYCRGRMQGDAILRLINKLDNLKEIHQEAYESAIKELTEAGIELPVNEGAKL